MGQNRISFYTHDSGLDKVWFRQLALHIYNVTIGMFVYVSSKKIVSYGENQLNGRVSLPLHTYLSTLILYSHIRGGWEEGRGRGSSSG